MAQVALPFIKFLCSAQGEISRHILVSGLPRSYTWRVNQ